MKKSLILLVVAGTGLAACEGGGDRQTGINSLGSFFAKAFRQDRNDTPLSLDGQTLPVFPTMEPFDV